MGEAVDVMLREFAAFDAQDIGGIVAVFDPDCEVKVAGARLRGSEQVVALFTAFWRAFPDMRVTGTHAMEAEAAVAVLARATGTHLGTLPTAGGDIPPTGRSVDFDVAEFAEVRGGVIATLTVVFDRMTMLEQLGVVPAAASA